jgi:hypothetical protein
MQLMAPDAFAVGDTGSNVEALADALPGAAATMVTKLIDFQVFHLTRAREVVAHMRTHTAVQVSGPPATCAPDAAISSASVDGSSSSNGCELGCADL